jgi:cyclohexa-1,5-dienecarbonyl-CoA hydratase
MGPARAADWVLTGTTHTAAEAAAAGLVTRLSKAGELERDFQAWLPEGVLAHSASSLRVALRGLRSTWQEQFFADLDRLERLYLGDLMSTHDAVEGVEAFLQKRKPVWSHGKAP